MFLTEVLEEMKAHILYSITFFPESHAVHEIMWKNVALSRPQMTILHMRIACWIPKGTNTHSEYVTVIVFPVQRWLHECASVLSSAFFACLV